MRNFDDKIIIEMFDNNKQSVKYELLDIEILDDVEYAVMMRQYSIDKEVEIFRLKHTKDKSATLYKAETNNYIIQQVYDLFKFKYKKYFDGNIIFEDEQ